MRKFVAFYRTVDGSLSFTVTDDHLSVPSLVSAYPFHTADCSPDVAIDESIKAFINAEVSKIQKAQKNIDDAKHLFLSLE